MQALLISAANVSKLLWGGDREVLREHLKVSDDSPLASRRLRNHFEHYDERTEKWAAEDPTRTYVDSNIGPLSAFAVGDPSRFMRNFDPETIVVSFRGESFEIQPVVEAAQAILGVPERGLGQEWATDSDEET